MSPANRAYPDMKYDPGPPLGVDWAGHVNVEKSDRAPDIPWL